MKRTTIKAIIAKAQILTLKSIYFDGVVDSTFKYNRLINAAATNEIKRLINHKITEL